MFKFCSQNKFLIWSLAIAVLFYLVVVLGLQLFENARRADYIPSDSLEYEEAARSMFNGFHFHPTRPMGFSFLIGLAYLFGIPSQFHFYWVLVLNIFCWLGVCVLLFRILKQIANGYIAFGGAMLFIFNVGNIAITGQVLTESVYTFTLCLFAFFLLRFVQTNLLKDLSCAVFILCFSALIRPGSIYLIIPALTWFLYKSRFKLKGELREHLLVLFGISILFFQMAMMKKEYGNFTVSYIDKITWYFYLGAEVEAGGADSNYALLNEARRKEFDAISWKEKYDRANSDLYQKISSRPGAVFNGLIQNTRYNEIGSSNGILMTKNMNGTGYFEKLRSFFLRLSYEQNVFYNFILKWILPVLFLGLLFKRKLFRSLPGYLLVLFCLSFYLFLVSGISFMQGDRFTIVYVPLNIICLCSLPYLLFRRDKKDKILKE